MALYDFSFHLPWIFFLNAICPILPNSTRFPYSFDCLPVNSSYGDFLFNVFELIFSISLAVLIDSAHSKSLALSSKFAARICACALWINTVSFLSTTPFCCGVFAAVFSSVIPLSVQNLSGDLFSPLGHFSSIRPSFLKPLSESPNLVHFYLSRFSVYHSISN
jgi:hypothetical protein